MFMFETFTTQITASKLLDIFNCLTGGACALPVEKMSHQCSKLVHLTLYLTFDVLSLNYYLPQTYKLRYELAQLIVSVVISLLIKLSLTWLDLNR